MAYVSTGENNGSGTALELFVQKFSTDVLKYFKDTNVMSALVTHDSIENGKSKSFPIVGNATASSRDQDTITELAEQTLKATERLISITAMKVGHSWISDLDMAMLHYDAKSAHVESIGRALAKAVDSDLIAKVLEAGKIDDATAAASAGLKTFDDDVFTESQSSTISSASGVATGAEVQALMAAAMTEFRDKDAVGDPVYVLRPQHYFALLNNPSQTGLTWVNDPYAQSGKVPMILGARVLYSPRFATFDAVTAHSNDIGVLFAKEAVGELELLGVNIRVDYIPTRLAHLAVGKMSVGYGILNHGSAIALSMTNG